MLDIHTSERQIDQLETPDTVNCQLCEPRHLNPWTATVELVEAHYQLVSLVEAAVRRREPGWRQIPAFTDGGRSLGSDYI